MKTALLVIGAILILTGIVGFAMGGFSFTREEKVVDIGPLEVNAERRETFPIPPALSLVLLAGGTAMVIGGALTKK